MHSLNLFLVAMDATLSSMQNEGLCQACQAIFVKAEDDLDQPSLNTCTGTHYKAFKSLQQMDANCAPCNRTDFNRTDFNRTDFHLNSEVSLSNKNTKLRSSASIEGELEANQCCGSVISWARLGLPLFPCRCRFAFRAHSRRR